MANICVYLGILESLLEVVIYGFVGDLADQSEIRDSDLLLLCRLVGCFPDLGLPTASAGLWLRLGSIFFATGSLGYSLDFGQPS